ncbi:MAG TPA: hypothetical protein VHV77_06690, partial [Pirellulales bacterium]|nr:hypothetical protein [Pirellulales bacterium]
MRIASLVITCCAAAIASASVEALARRALATDGGAADASAADPGPAGSGLEDAQRAVAEARTLVRFHLAEHGDLQALDEAANQLDHALTIPSPGPAGPGSAALASA